MKINFTNETIEVSVAFANKAKNVGSKEYNKIASVLEKYPSYKVVVLAPKKKSSYRGKGLTYDMMEKIINSNDNAESNLRAFEILKDSLSYLEVKKWFYSTFPKFKETDSLASVILATV